MVLLYNAHIHAIFSLIAPGILLYRITNVSGYSYVTKFFQVPLDHFSFAINTTFKIKYLYNDSYWTKNDGPIFFYTGNEGAIEMFADNTGFMWEVAEEFGAMVVFAEHRFYGESFPDNFSHRNNSVLGYLTVEQTLADYAMLLTELKKSLKANNSPVISFGGSYGGQLTFYLRFKYPHIVQGGIASSAPLFLSEASCELHDKVLRSVFEAGHPHCADYIRKSWDSINNITRTDIGKEWLKNKWNLCQSIDTSDNVTSLKSWLQTMYSNLGMVNYPYPVNFLRKLPAQPVKVFCQKLIASDERISDMGWRDTDEMLLSKLFEAINMYFNYTGSITCFDYTDVDDTSNSGFSSMDALSFDFQSCTELIDPACDDGIQDFFEPEPWNVQRFIASCEEDFGVTPQLDLMNLFYGGKNILAASNVIFSNGLLDPWHAYGVLKNLSNSLLAVVIENAAHHLDLRASNPMDPPSVVSAREFEKQIIRKWILQYQEDKLRVKDLLSYSTTGASIETEGLSMFKNE